MRILGLIPMRGGSKGIPGKNKKLLGGKPLMYYTIDAALQSELLTDVIVSTENLELAQIATDLGAEVPFMRPVALAKDTTSSIEVVIHALKRLKTLGRTYDAVCLLQVTTPFRTVQHIDMAIKTFQKAGYEALVSVQKVPHVYNPHWVFLEDELGHLSIATGDSTIIKRRQDLPEAYARDGAIYLTKAETILNNKSFYGSSLCSIELAHYKNINLDTDADWQLAEQRINS